MIKIIWRKTKVIWTCEWFRLWRFQTIQSMDINESPTPNRTEFSIQYYKIISFLKKCILKSLCIIDKNLPKYFKECFTTMFHNLKCWCESACSSCNSILHIPSSIILWSWIYGKSCYISWMWLIIWLCGNKREQRGEWEWSKNLDLKLRSEQSWFNCINLVL